MSSPAIMIFREEVAVVAYSVVWWSLGGTFEVADRREGRRVRSVTPWQPIVLFGTSMLVDLMPCFNPHEVQRRAVGNSQLRAGRPTSSYHDPAAHLQ